MTISSQACTPFSIGPALVCYLSAADIGLLTSVPASDEVSATYFVGGWKKISVGLTSTQAGTLKIARFLDKNGDIPQDNNNDFEIPLTADTAANLNIADGKPCQLIEITVTNSSGSIATLSQFALLLQAD